MEKVNWIPFFSDIADRIIEIFNPKTVLDAGCATGYLVEALRDRGVEAYGFDISEYAISKVREDIKPFCFVHSITEPLPSSLPQKFDLVVTIEVLEHLFPEEGNRAIANLCNYTDTVIFTSTPNDITDRTHVNVQQREYWARIFAEHSFCRNLLQPLDFICSWAMLFSRKDDISKVIFDYEINIRILESTLGEQEKCVKENNTKIQTELDYFNRRCVFLNKQIDDLKRKLAEVSGAYQIISTSSCWRMSWPLRLVLDSTKTLMKSNRLSGVCYKGLKSLKEKGFWYTWDKVKSKTYHRYHAGGTFKSRILSKTEIEKQKNAFSQKKIKYSIIVPLYNTPERYLKEMIDSIISQTYENWELCMADGSDISNNIEKLCAQYTKKYQNIKYKKLSGNLGISGNTIEAYKLATGNYFILLDHDDFLTQDALYELSCCIEENPTVDFIYSDRAIFSDKTKQILAYHFLPGYSPDFMRACNYASHLNAFSKNIIDSVGFIRVGYDGSQDYDLELRVMEKARKIINIPKVLYYCRACEGSVALNPESKMYAYEAGRRAIEEHIERIGYPGKVEFLRDTFSYRIYYNIKKHDKISIIIPNKDNITDLTRCINSILDKTDYENYEIIIVENNSVEKETFDYYDFVEKNKKVRVLYYRKDGFNYSDINNYAVNIIKTPYILFLNNDIEVINSNWLTEMLMFAQREDIGAVGAKLYYPNETLQHAGLYIGLMGNIASHYDHKKSRYETGYMHRLTMPQNFNALTAACLLVKRDDFIKVGGFDDTNFKIGLNDIDLCLKFRECGKINVLTPYAELYHYESVSRGSDQFGEAKMRYERESKIFREKWSKYYDSGDEYINPNFI